MGEFFWTGLLVGLIAGWMIEWVIDWVFWRRDGESVNREELEKLQAQLEEKERTNEELQQKLSKAQYEADQAKAKATESAAEGMAQAQARINALERENKELREKLAESEEDFSSLSAKMAGMSAQAAATQIIYAEADNLEDVNGIGPAFEKRLNEAGIHTFAQLAEQPPERIREIIGAKGWQKIDPEAWIEEAKRFAAEKSSSEAS